MLQVICGQAGGNRKFQAPVGGMEGVRAGKDTIMGDALRNGDMATYCSAYRMEFLRVTLLKTPRNGGKGA